MKSILLLFITVCTIYADVAVTDEYIYSFAQNGSPVTRIHSKTGNIEVPSEYGFIDMKFKTINKAVTIFDSKGYWDQKPDVRKRICTNYFNREIRDRLSHLDKEEIDRLLNIFISMHK